MTTDLGKLSYPSETSKYLSLTVPYCKGCGIDIASQGSPVVPWAWQLDLPPDEFAHYNAGGSLRGPIQLRGHAHALPVESGSLDFCYSSHLLEDYPQERWPEIMREWSRVLKSNGYLIILVPERERWNAAIARGQTPNCSHAGPEPLVGDMSKAATAVGLRVVIDQMTDLWPADYSILGVFQAP
jgi:SAM-dependent methyltransferase